MIRAGVAVKINVWAVDVGRSSERQQQKDKWKKLLHDSL
jgi:hypothetical protein